MAFARFKNVMFERSVVKCASAEQRRVATSWILNISIFTNLYMAHLFSNFS